MKRNEIRIRKENSNVNFDWLFNELKREFAVLPNGNYIVRTEKAVNKRTISQNNLMWLWFECIAQEFGEDRNSIHDHYCKKFLKYQTTVFGREETLTGKTRNLSTVAMGRFLDQVQADAAAEHGITLPNPQDDYFAEFETYYKHFI